MIGSDTTTAAPQPGTRPPRRRRTVGAALVEAVAVLGTSLRLFVRHWPVLFALFFAGAAVREFVVLGAVQASKINGVLGLLVVILGPIATLTALVLMLRALRPSLPWLAATTDDPAPPSDPAPTTAPAPATARTPTTAPATGNDSETGTETGTAAVAGGRPRRRRSLLDHLGSALVPFLAVYASWGYLQEDMAEYLYRLFADTYLADATIFTDPAKVAENAERRIPLSLTGTIVAVVAVAVVLRWLLSRWQERSRMGWLGIPGAYVEVIWISIVAATVAQAQEPALQWLQDRRIVVWLLDSWHTVVDQLGPLAGPVRAGGAFLAGAAGSVQVAVVVPLAWLAVGAVVYGHRLAPPAPSPADLMERAARRWRAMPRPVRAVGANLGGDLRERFTPMVHSFRLIARAGLAPMLFFCLAFLLAQTAREWLWEAERLLIGGQDLAAVWVPLSGPLALLNDAFGTVILACLLGAAVDRVLRIQPPTPSDTSGEASDGTSGDASAEAPFGDGQPMGNWA
ncbi:hypothetical protein [Plantactinospora endophytica]|uniref:Uncharacterized protein n=1 Tax=Plantactinospora endophytica TaxID=673535 RepID=A0ABQ4DW16_9ACTN|nr:hypothetical protein [Plantactinospora endophytica]GIG86648.1 hypothetical protein Pen02_15840 [Plantactinospora endophytica]